MTNDPETVGRRRAGGARKRRHGWTIAIAVVLVAAGVGLLTVVGLFDGVDDDLAQTGLPADPTVVEDQQAPAVTRPEDLPATGGVSPLPEPDVPVNGGMAPRPGDVAAPVGPAPAPAVPAEGR